MAYPVCLRSYDSFNGFEGCVLGVGTVLTVMTVLRLGFVDVWTLLTVLTDFLVLRGCVLGVWTVLTVLSGGVLSVWTVLTILSSCFMGIWIVLTVLTVLIGRTLVEKYDILDNIGQKCRLFDIGQCMGKI